jgi:hypothetical protein
LAIERMIVEGCDILMDVTQVFVRQGSLLHIVKEKARSQKGRLSLSSRRGSVGTGVGGERGEVRQCFLFSNTLIIATRFNSIFNPGSHLSSKCFVSSSSLVFLIATFYFLGFFLFFVCLVGVSFRTSDGKLHLLPEIGKIPFVDATLIEDPTETSSCDDDDGIEIIIQY